MDKKDFLILIGSDGSGKTTIANELFNILRYPVHHFGPPKNYQDGYNQYFGFIRDTDESVICDRFHEGEQIFAPIYRGYKATYFPELEQELKYKFKPLLVLVYAPFITITKRLAERGEDFVKPEHFRYAYDKVIDIFNESTLPKMMINTEDNQSNENVIKILKQVYS